MKKIFIIQKNQLIDLQIFPLHHKKPRCTCVGARFSDVRDERFWGFPAKRAATGK